MKVDQRFTVQAPIAEVWRFFDQEIELVGMCIPGAQQIEHLAGETYRLVVRQKVGHLGATFDLKGSRTVTTPGAILTLAGSGRSVKGARGDLRASAVVTLTSDGDRTDVDVAADVILSGMLASMGRKVIDQRISTITQEFAERLAKEIGESAQRQEK